MTAGETMMEVPVPTAAPPQLPLYQCQALALFRTAQARAAIAGRDHVIPDDIKALAESVLVHRVIVDRTATMNNVTPRSIIQNLLNAIPVPGSSAVPRPITIS